MDYATLEPSAEVAERQNDYKPNEPVDKWGHKVDAWEVQTTGEELADALWEYAAGLVVCNKGGCDNVPFVLPWYGYTPGGGMIKPPGHIPEHFIFRYCRQIKKNDAAW